MARPILTFTNTVPGLLPLGALPPKAAVAAFNSTASNSLIETKGMPFIHYMSAPLPDRNSFGAPPNPNTQGAYTGRIYYDSRPLVCVPTNIHLEQRLQVQGLYGDHSAVLNPNGEYSDSRPGSDNNVYIRHNDLLVPDFGMTIPAEQLIEYNPTGPQRLNFNVVGVQYLADSELIYEENTDFAIVDGMIVWLATGSKPAFNNGQGAVLTCIYFTVPIFCVVDIPHALRVLPANPEGSGAIPRKTTYFPQLIIAKNLTSANINPFNNNLLNAKQAPNLATYASGGNTTGGSF